MIKQLDSTLIDVADKYLKKLPMFSMYFRTDIENLKKYEDILYYGCFDDNEELVCIFCKAFNTLFLYSAHDTIPASGIADFLANNNIEFSIMRGQESVLKQFDGIYSFTTKHKTLLCKLSKVRFMPVKAKNAKIVRATRANTDELQGFFNCIDEYRGMFDYDMIVDSINFGYTFLLYEGSHLAAVSICNKRNRDIANISVLATIPAYRNKGYGTQILSYSCDVLLRESDSISICHEYKTYDRIYRLLGFEETGFIAMYIKQGGYSI